MTAPPPFRTNRFLQAVLVVYALVWMAMAIGPRDWPTWALENLLVFLVLAALAATYPRFRFSNLAYLLMAIFLCLHAVGAHSGYAHTPVGDWLKATLGLSRNPYDRVIHCMFGLLLVYPVRELLLRTAGSGRGAASWLAVSIIVAVSSCFEVIEAIAAELVSPGAGPAWLGAQGDEWDAQYDMAVALLGALAAILITWWREKAAATT